MRVTMHDGPNVESRTVDLAMNEALKIGIRLHRRVSNTVKVIEEHVGLANQRWRHASREQEILRVSG
jgi:hypothetical protein